MKPLLLVALALLLAAPGPFDPFGEAGIDERPGTPVPVAVPLVDAQGRATTLAELAGGKPLLLIPVLHECPNLCGVTLAGFTDAIAGQQGRPGRDFAVVAFGIDPNEGPADARADLARLHAARPRAPVADVRAVTGPASSIAAVTRAIGYRYAWDPRIGQYAHAAAAAVIAPDGTLSSWLYGVTPRPADLANALALARSGGSGSLVQQLILLCYHFDPETGRYSLLVSRVIKVAGIATVLAIGLLIFFLSRKRRAA
jgi:protein SCO1/2